MTARKPVTPERRAVLRDRARVKKRLAGLRASFEAQGLAEVAERYRVHLNGVLMIWREIDKADHRKARKGKR